MKKLEMIIQPEKLNDLKELLEFCEARGVMVTNIMGCGNQKGSTSKYKYRGAEYSLTLLPKIKVETVVDEKDCEKIIRDVCREISSGNYGDGKIFVHAVTDAVRIRTGERGSAAL